MHQPARSDLLAHLSEETFARHRHLLDRPTNPGETDVLMGELRSVLHTPGWSLRRALAVLQRFEPLARLHLAIPYLYDALRRREDGTLGWYWVSLQERFALDAPCGDITTRPLETMPSSCAYIAQVVQLPTPPAPPIALASDPGGLILRIIETGPVFARWALWISAELMRIHDITNPALHRAQQAAQQRLNGTRTYSEQLGLWHEARHAAWDPLTRAIYHNLNPQHAPNPRALLPHLRHAMRRDVSSGQVEDALNRNLANRLRKRREDEVWHAPHLGVWP